jgi:muramoyltetrapeptide carboxypeptidase
MRSKTLIRPPRLVPGSRVSLVAPAGPVLERDDLTRAKELCRALDYEPVLGKNAHSHYGYMAGTDDERIADLNTALQDSGTDAIWCIRGGYGSIRLLDRIDYAAMTRRPKPLIGFSDITALLNAITCCSGVVSFHGPVARSAMPEFSRDHFLRVLGRADVPTTLARLPRQPADLLVPQEDRIVPLAGGVAEGPLIGGNLTLLHCLVGTRYFPDFEGAILFLEDVAEDLYRVDRMLAHFRLLGILDRLAGVMIGRFTELDRSAPDGALGFDQVLATYLGGLGIPVAYGFPIGHIEAQWTMPLGVRARLNADSGQVDLLEPAVL